MRALILLLALAACSKSAETTRSTDDYSAEINQLAAKRAANSQDTANLSAVRAKTAEPTTGKVPSDLKRRVTDLERKQMSDDLDRRATFSEHDR